MGTLRILSSEGDTSVLFDESATAEAEALFKRMQQTYTAFRVEGPNIPATRLDKFDPTADEIVMVPKIVGG